MMGNLPFQFSACVLCLSRHCAVDIFIHDGRLQKPCRCVTRFSNLAKRFQHSLSIDMFAISVRSFLYMVTVCMWLRDCFDAVKSQWHRGN